MATLGAISVRSKVLDMLAGNPSLPYSTIGEVVGVTRERVRQIAQQSGYPARIGIIKSMPKKICAVCGKTFYTKNLYCSAVCGYMARRKRIVIVCKRCGNTFERSPSSLRNNSGNYFCNRACYRGWKCNSGFKAPRNGKYTKGDFVHRTGLKEEFPLKGKIPTAENSSKGEIFLKGEIPTSEILKIYDILLQLNENELVKININGFDDFKELGKAIRRKSQDHNTNLISAIIDIKKHSLLFVMRLTD